VSEAFCPIFLPSFLRCTVAVVLVSVRVILVTVESATATSNVLCFFRHEFYASGLVHDRISTSCFRTTMSTQHHLVLVALAVFIRRTAPLSLLVSS
jgi:hypothetical protein